MGAFTFSTANLSATLMMMLVGVLGIFLVLGVIVLCVYALNKAFSAKQDEK